MSTIKLKTFKWNDCFSFGSGNVIELDSSPITQIVAPNGYGKSSIPLILEETAYNKNSKGVAKADIPNRLIDDGYSTELDFLVDEDIYTIKVQRGSSIKVKLFKNSEDISSHKSTDTFKEIADIIGIDFKTFQQLVYQSTSKSLQFLSATDTARKKFLIDLFDLSEYVELFENFKSLYTDHNNMVSHLKGRLEVINKWISNNSDVELTVEDIPELPTIPNYNEEISNLTVKIKLAETDNTKIRNNLSIKEKLDSINIDKINASIDRKIDTSDLEEKKGQLSSVVTSSKATISKLKNLDSQCPTCLQTIDKTFYSRLLEETEIQLEAATLEINKIQQRLLEIKETNLLITKAENELLEYEKLESKYDATLDTKEIDVEDAKLRLKEIKQIAVEAERNHANILARIRKAESHNSKIEVYIEQSEKFEKELAEISVEIKEAQEVLSDLEILKNAFSSNGLIAYKLENMVADLEAYTNYYLSELSDGQFAIQFSTRGDKLDVILTDNGKVISASSPSSGEMARINLSTLLAIRKLMSSISKNTINVLFLDEVISVLDDYGREKLVEVLLKEDNLNTFLVSHSWTHPLVDKLVLVKENGISRIEHG